MDRRNRIVKFPADLILKVYKIIISPILFYLLGGACRYQPTCSDYCKDAINKHGLIKGSVFSVHRILRCNPLSNGGYDPA